MTTLAGQTRPGFRSPAYRYVRTTDKLPTVAEASAQDDPVLKVKLFNPAGAGTWWLAGYDPDTGLAWGVADIFERECGAFDVNELVAIRTRPFGLPIERDLWYTPARLSEVLAG